MKNRRTHHRLLRKTRHLSTPVAAEPMFLLWLYNALRDRAWRDLIEQRLREQELPVIELGNDSSRLSQSDGPA